jgi:hypothetical protein
MIEFAAADATKVPVASGSVNVCVLAELGAAMVKAPAPPAFPDNAIVVMLFA